jgi:hypothetical protein
MYLKIATIKNVPGHTKKNGDQIQNVQTGKIYTNSHMAYNDRSTLFQNVQNKH